MKYFILWVLFLFIFLNSQSQDKFRITSIDIPVFGIFSSTKSLPITTGGLSVGIGITTEFKKNIFSCEWEILAGFNLFEAYYSIHQYNLLYGRNFKISKRFRFEPNIGIGLFNEEYKDGDTNFKDVNSNTLGFPIKLNLFLQTILKPVSIGLSSGVNINSIATTYSVSFIIRWQFKTIK